MKKIYNFLIISLLLIFGSNSIQAEEIKIFYVDIDKIIKESNVGKKINKNIQSQLKKKIKSGKKLKGVLKKEMPI